jgi:hypothetical protein
MLDKRKLIRLILREDLILKHDVILPLVDNLVFKFVSIGSKRRIILAYKEYRQNGWVPKNVSSLIILANYRTKAKIRKILTEGNLKMPIEFKSSIFNDATLQVALQDLKKFGFANFGKILDNQILFELEKLNDESVFTRSGQKANFPDTNIGHIWYVDPKVVLENLGIQKLILDSFWKQIADSYLNSPTKISAIRCWHSFPQPKDKGLGPENWHIDAGDGLNFIKFFVLLTNVDKTNGPTSLVPISSLNLPRKFFTGRRFSNREIAQLLKKYNTQEILAVGELGTVYAIDTRLIHRGTPVETGHRFLVNWTVKTDKFGNIEDEKYLLKPQNLLHTRSDLFMNTISQV